MTAMVTAHGVTKRFGDVTALDDVSFALAEHTIYGLLGRNGAGKTTLMQILTGQAFASSGNVSVFDAPPVENPAVLSKVCFVRESQRYPTFYTVRHVFDGRGLAPLQQELQDLQSSAHAARSALLVLGRGLGGADSCL